MYEVDGYGDGEKNAIQIGQGGRSASDKKNAMQKQRLETKSRA